MFSMNGVTLDTVESVTAHKDTSGNYLEVVLINGATVMISVENDIITYTAPNEEEQTASLLCDMGAGMHDGSSKEVSVNIKRDLCIEVRACY
jgi:hypothetical protein